MDETSTPPRELHSIPKPPGGMDFPTEIALRLGRVESEQASMDREQRRHGKTIEEHHGRIRDGESDVLALKAKAIEHKAVIDQHATRLTQGDALFTSVIAKLDAIQGAITWTVKLIVGAVLTALLSLVIYKVSDAMRTSARMPSPAPSASSSSSLP